MPDENPGFFDNITAMVLGAQETLGDAISGGQETFRSVIGDVVDVPGEVAEKTAGPAAQAAADVAIAPIRVAGWLGLALIAGVVADEVLTGGKARKGIVG